MLPRKRIFKTLTMKMLKLFNTPKWIVLCSVKKCVFIFIFTQVNCIVSYECVYFEANSQDGKRV